MGVLGEQKKSPRNGAPLFFAGRTPVKKTQFSNPGGVPAAHKAMGGGAAAVVQRRRRRRRRSAAHPPRRIEKERRKRGAAGRGAEGAAPCRQGH